MKLLLIFITLCLGSVDSFAESTRVRRVPYGSDQIVTVRTALGIATIIQVPDRPTSLVVGDTESFKVEYLDQAITIKPLHGSARSNLYIYTDYRRFNVQLLTGAEPSADYVVYLDSPKEKSGDLKSTLRWMRYKQVLNNDSLSLEVGRLGRTRDGLLVVEFKLKSKNKEQIDPKWFWLTQNGSTKPIHRLVLSGLQLDQKNAITGILQILRADLDANVPIRLEVRRKRNSYLTLPAVNVWR